MAELKRRSLKLHSGKEIKLYGTSLAISKTYEIGEGGAPSILTFIEPQTETSKVANTNGTDNAAAGSARKQKLIMQNPHNLSVDELYDIADYQIRLWVEFKDSLRKNGLDPKLFKRDSAE